MKKVFILKAKNERTGEIKELSNWAIKDYQFAVSTLKDKLIDERYNLSKDYKDGEDMTEILKGFIEVYETNKGQMWEISSLEPIKTYNYGF